MGPDWAKPAPDTMYSDLQFLFFGPPVACAEQYHRALKLPAQPSPVTFNILRLGRGPEWHVKCHCSQMIDKSLEASA